MSRRPMRDTRSSRRTSPTGTKSHRPSISSSSIASTHASSSRATALPWRRFTRTKSRACRCCSGASRKFTGPGRVEARDLRMDRATRHMRALQVAEAHQEFADNFAAGKSEGLFEELYPFLLAARMMRIEPGGERAVTRADRLQPFGVLDRRLDLQPVADDAGIVHQPLHVARREGCDLVDVVTREGGTERRAFL